MVGKVLWHLITEPGQLVSGELKVPLEVSGGGSVFICIHQVLAHMELILSPKHVCVSIFYLFRRAGHPSFNTWHVT